MTRARDNSFNPFNNQVAGKNLCINGGFDHWQRGNSFGSSNSVYVFTADRWEIVRHGYQLGMTVSRQTAGLDGFRYCARIQRDSGNTSTNNLQFQTSFETSEVLPFINKTMTISFYARKSTTASSSSLTTQIISGTGTDQPMKSYTGGTVSFQQTFTLTDSWQRFSFSGSVLSPYTEFGIWFGYTPSGTAGAADYVEITGVQIELGASTTQFSRAGGTIGGELALCQRYFERKFIWEELCFARDSNLLFFNLKPLVEMRAPWSMYSPISSKSATGTTTSSQIGFYGQNGWLSGTPALTTALVGGGLKDKTAIFSGLTVSLNTVYTMVGSGYPYFDMLAEL
jgi:hypothetical protein